MKYRQFMKKKIDKIAYKPILAVCLLFTIMMAENVKASDQSGQYPKIQPQFYAVWNEFPHIEANDRYFSLEETQAGRITKEEILSRVEVTDREDGVGSSHILENDAGHEWITLPDYSAEELQSLQHDGKVSLLIQVKDSEGAVTQKRITLHINDVTPVETAPVEYRFIESRYTGTLSEDSVWVKKEAYRQVLDESLQKNSAPLQSWHFDKEEIKAAKQYTDEHGFANYSESHALAGFYEQFYH